MERAPKAVERWPASRRRFASWRRGYVILALAIAAWMVVIGIGWAAWAILS